MRIAGVSLAVAFAGVSGVFVMLGATKAVVAQPPIEQGSTAVAAPVVGAPGPEGALPLAILETRVFGIDPVVGEHVTDQLRQTSRELGYRLVAAEEVSQAEDRVPIEGFLSPADLWRVTYLVSGARGVATRAWASEGNYVFEITVASLDGTGPFFGRGEAPAEGLRQAVAQALLDSLPPPSTWQPQHDMRSSQTGSDVPGVRSADREDPFSQHQGVNPAFADPGFGFQERTNAPLPGELGGHKPVSPEGLAESEPRRRWNLALQTEGAIGTSQESFYNHLAGVRVGYRFADDVIGSLYLGYANLRGKNQRANNLVTWAQIEDRVRVLRGSNLTIPLRLAVGYVPFNGPVFRLSAGVNIPLGERFELGFDLLAPTLWVLPDRAAVSMNVGAELIWRP